MTWMSLDAESARGYRSHRLATTDLTRIERLVHTWWEGERVEASGIMVMLDENDPTHLYVSPEWPSAPRPTRTVPPDAAALTRSLAAAGLVGYRDTADLRTYVPAGSPPPSAAGSPVYRTIWFTGPASGTETLVEKWLEAIYGSGGPVGAWLVQGLDDPNLHAISTQWPSAEARETGWVQSGTDELLRLLGPGKTVIQTVDLQQLLWQDR